MQYKKTLSDQRIPLHDQGQFQETPRKIIKIDTPTSYGMIVETLTSIFNFVTGSYSWKLGNNVNLEIFNKGFASILIFKINGFQLAIKRDSVTVDLKYIDFDINKSRINISLNRQSTISTDDIDLYIKNIFAKARTLVARLGSVDLEISNFKLNVQSITGVLNMVELTIRSIAVSVSGPLDISAVTADIKSTGGVNISSAQDSINLSGLNSVAIGVATPPSNIPGSFSVNAATATYLNSPVSYLNSTPTYHMTNAEELIKVLNLILTALTSISAGYIPLNGAVPGVVNGQISAIISQLPLVLNTKLMG